MVLPSTVAQLCPQCGADVRAAGTRCASCGFYLPAAPAPRTGPPLARPVPVKDDSKRQALLVLALGGAVVLGLMLVGAAVALRSPSDDASLRLAAPVAPAPSPSAAEPPRLEPSALFAEARRRALEWHPDAVLVTVEISGLDARGVTPDGGVVFVYSRPSGQRFTGGAETSPERLTLRSEGGALSSSNARGVKAQVVPEPNCLFEDAWSTAQRAGAAPEAGLGLRYAWSDKHARPVWELRSRSGEVTRRIDGVSCSILMR